MAIVNLDNLLNQLKAQTAQTGKTVFNATGATTTPNYGADNNFAFNSSDFYNDNNNITSASDAAFELQKNSTLFDRRIMDNACNISKELTQHAGLKGEELDEKLAQDCAIWTVDQREDTNGDGVVDDTDELVTTTLVDAIIDSYDSELDLYIEAKMQEVIETYGADCVYNLKAIFGSYDSPALKELAALGIKVDGIGDHDKWQNRTYTFSLVDVSGYDSVEDIMTAMYGDGTYDENGIPNGKEEMKILEDANGKKGSIIFSDCLTADGTAQGAELNLSSILDMMGYDLISKADFVGREDEYADLLENIQSGLDNNLYRESNATIDTMYGETLSGIEAINAVYNVNGANRFKGWWSDEFNTFEYTRSRVRSGHYEFGGGYAQKGERINYGNTDIRPEFSSYDELSQSLEEALERANDMSLTEAEREDAQKEAEKIKEQLKNKENTTSNKETQETDNQVAQQQLASALEEAQELDEDLSEEEKEEALQQIADKYDVEIKDILDELK